MTEIKDYPEKLSRDDSDRLLLQIADNSYRHITAENFISGISSGSGGISYALLQDQKASGTHAGVAVAGAWNTRDLNTIVQDDGIITSLSGSQFTLAAGTYLIQAIASLWSDNGVQQSGKARIFNVTDGAIALLGLNARQHILSGSSAQGFNPVNGRIQIATSKTFRLEQRLQSSYGNPWGLGLADSFGVSEIYSEVQIWKIG